ncbi:MAG: VanZ family protein [Desulfobacterales bacterium]|nr:VanZ family protein [Desulfobacterales bacterium]
MRPLFTILSIAYIATIFLFADSSVVSDLSSFNPYSLLHIPLYGILTALLIFSFVPFKFNSRNHLFVAALFAFIVAIADEIHQAYVPGRDASLTDVLLDMAGIGIVIFFTSQLFLKKESPKTRLTL